MNINELIINFIDGSTTPEMDKSLFNELANNEIAQQKFKKFIEIENSFSTGHSHFQPSAESVNQVFTKLGFKKAGMFGAFRFFQSNFVRFSVPAVLTTLLLVFSYNYFFEDDKNSLTSNELLTNNKQVSNQTKRKISKENPLSKENVVENNINTLQVNNKQSSSKIQYIYKEKYVAVGRNGDLKYFNNQEDLASYFNSMNENQSANLTLNDDIFINNIDLSELSNNLNYTSSKFNTNSTNIQNINYAKFNSKEDSDYEINLNYSPSFDVVSRNINPEKLSSFNHLGLNVLYKLNNKFKLGLEIQQETFLQKFEENDEFNRTLIYTQRPNFTNIGIALKYNFLDEIYLQSSFGTNTELSGVYNRFRLGREFNNIYPINFVAGLEHSALHYNFKNELYSSYRFGLYLGIKL